jgi:putative ABC transport system permease protein
VDVLIQDLRYAIRTLLKSPGFTIVAVLCFALGIGANTVMFGVVDTLLFRPPPHVTDAGRVARLYFTEHGRRRDYTSDATSYPEYQRLRDGVPAFASVAAYWTDSVTIGRAPEIEKVSGSMVAGSFFSTLGVTAALGRFFGPADDTRGGAPVIVLANGLWRSRFGGDSLVVGRALRIGTTLYTVVGVAPAGFTGADLRPVDLWLPLAVAAPRLFARDALTSPYDEWLNVVARLAPGADAPQATAQANVAYVRGERPGAEAPPATRVTLGPIQLDRGPQASRGAKVSTWLAAVAAIVLLIACANVANLLLARGMHRRREIAVRLALGAGRGRLARQLVVESLLLALFGGAAALLVAVWGAPLIRAFTLPPEVASRPIIDLRVLAFTGVVVVVTGILSGLVPALESSRPDLATALKAGERDGVRQRSPLRSTLLAGQVALTLVLMTGAGLFVRSLRNVHAIDLGLDVRQVLAVSLDFRGTGYGPRDVVALYWRLLDRAAAIPGVERVSAAMGGSFGQWSFGARVSIPGRDSVPALAMMSPYFNAVTRDFFATTGTRIEHGRALTAADGAAKAKVAVIGSTMARLLWPGQDPLGQCFVFGRNRDCTEVVGVAGDVHRQDLVEEPQMQFYVPLARGDTINTPSVLYLRASGDARGVAATVRRDLQGLEGNLAQVTVTPIEDLVRSQLVPWQLGAAMCGAFGALAMVLAAFGLYAVLAYSVTQRRQEMGIRLALGADAGAVFRLIVGDGLRVAAAGTVVGLLAALAAGKLVASLLYGVSPRDPLVLASAALVVVAVAAAASYIPARRATKVDPLVALRSE